MPTGSMTVEMHTSILLKLAEQVISIKQLDESAEDLAQKPLLLYQYALQTPISWKKIANELSEDRCRICHWYRETHSRTILNIKMTKEDRMVIKEMIIAGIKDRSILNPNFYSRIRERFGMKYPRQELRMTYNNVLHAQDVSSVLNECSVVLRRRAFKSKIKSLGPETLARPMLSTNILSQIPHMFNSTILPQTQTNSIGGQILMNTLPITSMDQSIMHGITLSNSQEDYVIDALQPGAVTESESSVLSAKPPSLAHITQTIINPNTSFSYIQLSSSITAGVYEPYYEDLSL